MKRNLKINNMPTYENDNQVQVKSQLQKNPDEVGACWRKVNDRGIEYLSLKLEIDGQTFNLKGFLNSAKSDGDARPDFIIYKSKNINKNKEVNGNK